MFDTEVIFSGEGVSEADFDLSQHLVTAALGYRVDDRWSLQLALGAVVTGELVSHDSGARYAVDPGPVVALQGSAQILGKNPNNLILQATLTLGASFVSTSPRGASADNSASLVAIDARLSLNFGATLFDRWTPYLFARAFGGPILWSQGGTDLGGTDRYHYALGVGTSIALPERVALFVDWAFLGERSLAAGASVGF